MMNLPGLVHQAASYQLTDQELKIVYQNTIDQLGGFSHGKRDAALGDNNNYFNRIFSGNVGEYVIEQITDLIKIPSVKKAPDFMLANIPNLFFQVKTHTVKKWPLKPCFHWYIETTDDVFFYEYHFVVPLLYVEDIKTVFVPGFLEPDDIYPVLGAGLPNKPSKKRFNWSDICAKIIPL